MQDLPPKNPRPVDIPNADHWGQYDLWRERLAWLWLLIQASSSNKSRQAVVHNRHWLVASSLYRHSEESRCVHCLSLGHWSPQCNWSQDSPDMPPSPKPSSWSYSQSDPKSQSGGICRSWNRDPRPGCSFPNCKFQHICSTCFRNPASMDKSHKAVFCPYCPHTTSATVASTPSSM